jgi:hypothetical protein
MLSWVSASRCCILLLNVKKEFFECDVSLREPAEYFEENYWSFFSYQKNNFLND